MAGRDRQQQSLFADLPDGPGHRRGQHPVQAGSFRVSQVTSEYHKKDLDV